MSSEIAPIDRTECSRLFKARLDIVPSRGYVPLTDQAAPCCVFTPHLGAPVPVTAIFSIDHVHFGTTKFVKRNDGENRRKEGNGQVTHKTATSADLTCSEHEGGAFDIISSNQTAPARHLHARGSTFALKQSDTAFDGLMALSGSKTHFGRRH